eukprot:12047606-Ditylum_brightwellii.AAC.1
MVRLINRLIDIIPHLDDGLSPRCDQEISWCDTYLGGLNNICANLLRIAVMCPNERSKGLAKCRHNLYVQ